jgi:hypothetical protein
LIQKKLSFNPRRLRKSKAKKPIPYAPSACH